MYGAHNLPPTDFHVLTPETPSTVVGVEVFPFRVPHQTTEVSLALKIRYAGKEILFSGDSAWTDRFIQEASRVDLFICECTFYDEGPGNHVRYTVLKHKLPQLTCRRMILTHLGEEMLERHDQLAPVCANDGMVLDLEK
jgi:ribonuclease BN (tRNA processing enzyme)